MAAAAPTVSLVRSSLPWHGRSHPGTLSEQTCAFCRDLIGQAACWHHDGLHPTHEACLRERVAFAPYSRLTCLECHTRAPDVASIDRLLTAGLPYEFGRSVRSLAGKPPQELNAFLTAIFKQGDEGAMAQLLEEPAVLAHLQTAHPSFLERLFSESYFASPRTTLSLLNCPAFADRFADWDLRLLGIFLYTLKDVAVHQCLALCPPFQERIRRESPENQCLILKQCLFNPAAVAAYLERGVFAEVSPAIIKLALQVPIAETLAVLLDRLPDLASRLSDEDRQICLIQSACAGAESLQVLSGHAPYRELLGREDLPDPWARTVCLRSLVQAASEPARFGPLLDNPFMRESFAGFPPESLAALFIHTLDKPESLRALLACRPFAARMRELPLDSLSKAFTRATETPDSLRQLLAFPQFAYRLPELAPQAGKLGRALANATTNRAAWTVLSELDRWELLPKSALVEALNYSRFKSESLGRSACETLVSCPSFLSELLKLSALPETALSKPLDALFLGLQALPPRTLELIPPAWAQQWLRWAQEHHENDRIRAMLEHPEFSSKIPYSDLAKLPSAMPWGRALVMKTWRATVPFFAAIGNRFF